MLTKIKSITREFHKETRTIYVLKALKVTMYNSFFLKSRITVNLSQVLSYNMNPKAEFQISIWF